MHDIQTLNFRKDMEMTREKIKKSIEVKYK